MRPGFSARCVLLDASHCFRKYPIQNVRSAPVFVAFLIAPFSTDCAREYITLDCEVDFPVAILRAVLTIFNGN